MPDEFETKVVYAQGQMQFEPVDVLKELLSQKETTSLECASRQIMQLQDIPQLIV